MTKKLFLINTIKYALSFLILIIILYQFVKFQNFVYIALGVFYLLLISVYEITTRMKPLTNLKEFADLRRDSEVKLENQLASSRIENKFVQENINDVVKRLRQKEDELGTLRAASEMFVSDFNIEAIIEYIYNILKKITGCDNIIIASYVNDDEKLICKYEVGERGIFTKARSFDKGNDAKSYLENRKCFMLTNIIINQEGARGDRIVLPIKLSNEQRGVFIIESRRHNVLSMANIAFVESIVNYAVIAVNNAELFNNIVIQKMEIEALYEETTAVNEELSSYIEDLSKAKEELKEKNSELTRYYSEVHDAYLQTVMTLANAIEAKDAYTRGHCQRVMEVSCELATRMGLDEEAINDLKHAAILHDIGKIGIPAAIINKNGKLTDEEYNEIKKHPAISHSILKDIEFIKKGLEGILHHHERYDGKGYPYGIKGEEISLFGRILCIADAFDAMTSDRPYRKGMPMEKAIEEIERCKGTQFDPEIADLFISMSREIIP